MPTAGSNPLGPGEEQRVALRRSRGRQHIPAPPQTPKQDLVVLFSEGQVLAAIYMSDYEFI